MGHCARQAPERACTHLLQAKASFVCPGNAAAGCVQGVGGGLCGQHGRGAKGAARRGLHQPTGLALLGGPAGPGNSSSNSSSSVRGEGRGAQGAGVAGQGVGGHCHATQEQGTPGAEARRHAARHPGPASIVRRGSNCCCCCSSSSSCSCCCANEQRGGQPCASSLPWLSGRGGGWRCTPTRLCARLLLIALCLKAGWQRQHAVGGAKASVGKDGRASGAWGHHHRGAHLPPNKGEGRSALSRDRRDGRGCQSHRR